MRGRDFVLPDDVKAMAVAALAHRLVLRPELWVSRHDAGARGRESAPAGARAGGRARVSWHPTALNVSFLTLVGWALFLAVLTGRADLVMSPIPLVVALVAGRRRRRRGAAHRSRVSADRLFEDERVTVTLTLRRRRARCRWWSCWSRCRRGCISSAGAITRSSRCGRARRSTGTFAAPRARAVSTCAWRSASARLGTAGTLARPRHAIARRTRWPSIRGIAPIRHLPRPLRTQTFVGNYVSPTQGEGIEPGDIRPLRPRRSGPARELARHAAARHAARHAASPGAQRRRRAPARHAVRRRARTARTVVDVAARGAAALAVGYLARKDRVGLIEYGGQLRWVRPGSGRAQLAAPARHAPGRLGRLHLRHARRRPHPPAHPAAPGAGPGAQPAARRALRAGRERPRGARLRPRRHRGLAGGGGPRGRAPAAAVADARRAALGAGAAARSSTSTAAAG